MGGFPRDTIFIGGSSASFSKTSSAFQADQQWQDVVRGVLSHLRHALAAGFVALPGSEEAPLSIAQSSNRAEVDAEQGGVPVVEDAGCFSIGPGCSGYEEVGKRFVTFFNFWLRYQGGGPFLRLPWE